MAKGLPKSLIKKYGISKKAWRIYRAGKTRVSSAVRSKRKAYKSKTQRYVRRRTYMARRKRSYSRRARSFLSFSTIAKFIKIGALVAPAIDSYQRHGGGLNGAKTALFDYSGWNSSTHSFDVGVLTNAWMPYLATCLVTTGIQKLNGIIRRL